MAALFNSCEGTPGAGVTNANTAGPNQFDSVLGSGVTSFDAAHPHAGSTGLKTSFAANVAANPTVAVWDASIVTPAANSYCRMYVWLSAGFTVVTYLCAMRTGAIATSANASFLQVTPAGVLAIANQVGTQVAATTGVVPIGRLVRVEYETTGISGSTGNVACRFYSGANLEGNTPDVGGSASAAGAAVGGTVTAIRWGTSSSTTQTAAVNLWYDDVAWSDTAQPGSTASTTVWGRSSKVIAQAVKRASFY